MSAIQESALRSLIRFKEICDHHNLDYFLYSGTLLGAIRHDGFIPWDDDIDVGMPREDYGKLIEILKVELKDDPNLSLQIRGKDDPYFAQDFMKIINNDLDAKEKVARTQKQVIGSWVDIFPFDNIPDDLKLRQEQLDAITRLNRLIYIFLLAQPSPTDTGVKKMIKATLHGINTVCHKLYFFLPGIFKKKEALMRQYNHEETEFKADLAYTFAFDGPTLEKTKVANADFYSGNETDFEGTLFKIPRNPEIPLETLFGNDYMELPPESERVTHTFQ